MGHIDDIKRDLEVGGIRVVTCVRLENDTGHQIRCRAGEVINVYDSGKVVVQGQNQAAVKTALGLEGGPAVRATCLRTPSTDRISFESMSRALVKRCRAAKIARERREGVW